MPLRSIDTTRPLLNRLGLVYHQTQNLTEAERYYREALKQNPFYLEALNNIGTIEYVRKQYDRAMDQYNRALKLRPESPTILLNIGACLFAMEREDEGLKAYSTLYRSIRKFLRRTPTPVSEH